MEKIIQIDGRDICFRATAAIPRLYRIKFGRDIMQDMKDIQQAVEKAQNGEEPIPVKLLEVFENVAYGQTTMTYDAMVNAGKDIQRDKIGGVNRWSGLKVSFSALAPQRRPV